MGTSEKTTDDLATLGAGLALVLPEKGLAEKLALAVREKRPLVVKLGFDPTAPDLHLGHAVVLRKLREFQDRGHKIVVIVGDFTARIGDPTGRNKTRPPLAPEDIDHNAETYINQLGKILDLKKIEVKRNAGWLGTLDLSKILGILSKLTLAQILAREDFANRHKNNIPVSLHELLYPVMQAYDSVEINADIEIGGTDQMFNCLVGRQLQEAYGRPAQIVICLPILPGTDGVEKMSKSKNNYVGLTEPANDMYGKIMSIPDTVIPDYLNLATTFDAAQKAAFLKTIGSGGNPMDVKKAIAAHVVETYHDAAAAQGAAQHFYIQVQNRDLAQKEYSDVALTDLGVTVGEAVGLLDLCHKIEKDQSRSVLRRLIEGGGVSLDGAKTDDPAHSVTLGKAEILLKIGKRGFYRLGVK